MLDNLWWFFTFSNCIGEIAYFTLDLLKKVRYLTLTLLKVSFCGASGRRGEFKPLIIEEILDLPKKSSKTRKAFIIGDPQLNIIASVELLKFFFEVIVASKVDPIARIEKQAIS